MVVEKGLLLRTFECQHIVLARKRDKQLRKLRPTKLLIRVAIYRIALTKLAFC